MKKFLVMIQRKPSFTGESIQGHREFLKSQKETDNLFLAGGFEDASGGAYVLQANSLEEASNMLKNDPMYQENESVYTIKQWKIN